MAYLTKLGDRQQTTMDQEQTTAELLRDQIAINMADTYDCTPDGLMYGAELKKCKVDWNFSKRPGEIVLKTDKGDFLVHIVVSQQ